MNYFSPYLLALIFVNQLLFAQNITPYTAATASDSLGNTLPWAWLGGYATPHCQAFHLDNDAWCDLIVFDRATRRITTYLNKGIADSVAYQYAPQYEALFPPIEGWVLAVDYNCDGQEDLFTPNSGNIVVYDVIRNGDSFVAQPSYVSLAYWNPFFGLITADPVSMPAIVDIDQDGDIDILSLVEEGYRTAFFKNTAIEQGLGCDTLVFDYAQKCWGEFIELNANTIELFADCQQLAPDRHGSTAITAIDPNNDGVHDLLLSDAARNHTIWLHNGGTATTALIDEQMPYFPSYDQSLISEYYMTPAYIDINNDQHKDLVFGAGNGLNPLIKPFEVYLYEASSQQFLHSTTPFLSEQTIDVGMNSQAFFGDYNADQLTDLLVMSGRSRDTDTNTYQSRLWVYQNIATNAAPSYQLVSTDYQQLSSQHQSYWHATWGDTDADTDPDMLIGTQNGSLVCYTNHAAVGSAPLFNTAVDSCYEVQVEYLAKPCLFDIDNDQRLDLFVGNRWGSIAYYHNVGTISQPQFELVTNTFAGISTSIDGNFEGQCSPALWRSWQQRTYLLAGSGLGNVFLFEILSDANQSYSAQLLTDDLLPESSPIYTNIALQALNDYQQLLAVGSFSGGVQLYLIDDYPTNNALVSEPTTALVYPNPATNFIHINNTNYFYKKIIITNLLGEILLHQPIEPQQTWSYAIEHLSAGVYVVKLIDESVFQTAKFIKK